MQTEPKAARIIDENTKIFAETHGAPTLLSPLPNRASPFQVGEGCCRLPEEKPTILAERSGHSPDGWVCGALARGDVLGPAMEPCTAGDRRRVRTRRSSLRSIVHTTTLAVPKGPRAWSPTWLRFASTYVE